MAEQATNEAPSGGAQVDRSAPMVEAHQNWGALMADDQPAPVALWQALQQLHQRQREKFAQDRFTARPVVTGLARSK